MRAKKVVILDPSDNTVGLGDSANPLKTEGTDRPWATKITTVGSITYIGIAEPGSLQASAVWRCMKYNDSTGVVTWADGNGNFDNSSTDLTSLTYS
jgi:hypothetical protein